MILAQKSAKSLIVLVISVSTFYTIDQILYPLSNYPKLSIVSLFFLLLKSIVFTTLYYLTTLFALCRKIFIKYVQEYSTEN